MIYGYVYEHNSDTQKTATKPKPNDEEAGRNAEVCSYPIGISLEHTAPPTKNAILPCRQLYLEMEKMQNVAYRAYWTNNQFDFKSKVHSLPSDEDLQHICHFSSSGEDTICLISSSSSEDGRRVFFRSSANHSNPKILDMITTSFIAGATSKKMWRAWSKIFCKTPGTLGTMMFGTLVRVKVGAILISRRC